MRPRQRRVMARGRSPSEKLISHAALEAKTQKIMAAKTVKPKTENGETDK